MKKMVYVGLVGLILAAAGAAEESNPSEGGINTIYDLGSLFVEHQYFFLPIVPPGEEVLLQPYGPVVPVDWNDFPKEFVDQVYGMEDVDGFPIYYLNIYEDPVTRDIVFMNLLGDDFWRLAPEEGYDPYAWQTEYFNLKFGEKLNSWYRWIFDPAHVAASLRLIPAALYDNYFQA